MLRAGRSRLARELCAMSDRKLRTITISATMHHEARPDRAVASAQAARNLDGARVAAP